MQERTKRLEMLLGERAMERLAAAQVIVFGLGGVGSWCAEALARSGVGKLTIVDEDSFSESNINRQLGALGSTVGRPKAEAMAERLRGQNAVTDREKALILAALTEKALAGAEDSGRLRREIYKQILITLMQK